MWGNRLGWILSAVSVIAMVMFISWVNAVSEQAGPRTDFSQDTANAAAIELPVPPKTVLPSMTQFDDAAPIYRRAVEEYEKAPLTYEGFVRTGRQRDIEDIPAIRILLEATKCASARLFAEKPGEIVNFTNEKPALDALRTLGMCARRAAQLTEKDDPAGALKLYEAEFSLGAKLYQERLCWAELDAGLTLMAEGSKMIGLLAESTGDSSRAAACKQFDDARIAYVNQHLLPARRIISSVEPAIIEEHAGDVIYFARHAGERMWRVEAIFKLGRYRFNAARLGDQRTALKVLRELATDSDPTIRAAAIAARDLTEPQYRMLR